jgi:hypothetical protein
MWTMPLRQTFRDEVRAVCAIRAQAFLFMRLMQAAGDMKYRPDRVPACRYLHITTADMIPTLHESQRQIRSLRRPLGK